MPDIASGWFGHEQCEWEKVGSCVYCKGHGTRLYHGDLPTDQGEFADALRTVIEAAKRWHARTQNDGTVSADE